MANLHINKPITQQQLVGSANLSNRVLAQLSALQPHSKRYLPDSILGGFASNRGGRHELVRFAGGNRGVYVVPTMPLERLLLKNTHSRRAQVMTFDAANMTFLRMLNKELNGGESYPILEAVIDVALGPVGTLAGVLFTAGCAGINLSRRSPEVLARAGDEIWMVEEIGKVMQGAEAAPVHVSSYFLVDPYRSNSTFDQKGWLIHEKRMPVRFE